ncbi:C45 family autoproteolytic acyltransferase/hydrolase [Planctomycetota bacterium]
MNGLNHIKFSLLCVGLLFCGTAQCGEQATAPKKVDGVVRLEGTPAEIGRWHGRLLADGIRVMIGEYVAKDVEDGKLNATMLSRINKMKPSLPDWYMEELRACAKAVGIDEDVLLYAQCEGDIKSVGACTTYVAFGEATHDGGMEIGRNLDYWGLDSTDRVAIVLAVVPKPEDGYAFVSVGWTGILGGWTFFNEKGLFVANNLGGFNRKNPKGIPTLILERIVAQKAATVEEAIAMIKKLPRMRGQALVIGQVGDAAKGVKPDAAVVLYDAEQVDVTRHTKGFAFHTSIGTDRDRLVEILKQKRRKPITAIKWAGNRITLHSVAIRPQEWSMWVAHGRKPSAHLGKYVRHDIRSLLKRK